MKYQVLYLAPYIQKKFEKILEYASQEERDEIITQIEKLADHPRPRDKSKLKPPLIIYQYAAQYRLRVGNYKIVYDVDDRHHIVWILDLIKQK